ncbi:hypothetical protein HOLleu_11406 [Holothuria leucospilota]|uniref:Uncharacterized protein n=1 Tax=Holothuria leucospilota TaxID=206669 RepID=A0A9Q1HF51_HOLLE|nr:hypothetical protein HOLleu_11406 [Holothuria leucospilota]
MDAQDYEKLLHHNITQKFKLAGETITDKIDKEADEIANRLGISDRINKTAKQQAFVTLKDQKENFRTRPKCRLINPTKNELGRISKAMMDRINDAIRTKSPENQWRSTQEVLTWFNNHNLSFLIFDIVDFYPSIAEKLLKETLAWAQQFTPIPNTEGTLQCTLGEHYSKMN